MIKLELAKERDIDFIKSAYKKLDLAMMKLVSQIVGESEEEAEEEALHTEEYWLNLIMQKTGFIIVAFADDVPVGMAVVEKVDKAECHLEDLYVESVYRRQGIGKKLVEQVKQQAKKSAYKNMSLNVLPNNEKARILYEEQNFKEMKIHMVCKL